MRLQLGFHLSSMHLCVLLTDANNNDSNKSTSRSRYEVGMLGWTIYGVHLVTAGDAGELVAGPHAEDGSHCEVGVHNGGAIEGVKGYGEAGALQVDWLGDLL